jgi:hypothetical protein
MSGEISRRTFLRGTLAGVVVVGFDTGSRSWVSAAELEQNATALAEDFPSFDGGATAGRRFTRCRSR